MGLPKEIEMNGAEQNQIRFCTYKIQTIWQKKE